MKNSIIKLVVCLCLTWNSTLAYANNNQIFKDNYIQASDKIIDHSICPQTCTSFADIVEPLIPTVVNIYTVKYKKQKSLQEKRRSKSPFPDNFAFEKFNELFEQFDIPFDFEEMYSNPKAESLGSGFIIDPSGFIVTNHHVISNADEINVKLTDNSEFTAKLIGSDQRTDLALLKIQPKSSLPFAKFGDANKARVGDRIITIGNPFGLGGTVTTGIISSKARDIESEGIVDNFIQTDAAINRGNSGGPMFNIQGEVIGINTAIFSPSGTNIGIGFAIPATTAKNIIDQLKKNGKVSRGKLDIYLQEITTELAEGLGIKENSGALVVDVMPGGTGDKAGIKAGDIITTFAGQEIKNSRKLQVLVAEAPINQDAKIVVIRNGQKLELTAKIVEQNETGTKVAKNSIQKEGLTFSNLTPELRKKFAIESATEGVVITNMTSSHRLLKIGDLVIKINQTTIKNVDQLEKIFAKAKEDKKQHVVLMVKRTDNINIFVALPIN